MGGILKVENIRPVPVKGHQHENKAQDRFCRICGEQLVVDTVVTLHACDACRHPVDIIKDNYCGFCGVLLDRSSVRTERFCHRNINEDDFAVLKASIEKSK